MHPLIRLTSLDGGPVFWSGIADLITSSPHGTVIKTAATSRLDALWAQVRESPEEVERLRSEALRPALVPAPGVTTARAILLRFAAMCGDGEDLNDARFFEAVDDVLGTSCASRADAVAALRNLAARLGGAS